MIYKKKGGGDVFMKLSFFGGHLSFIPLLTRGKKLFEGHFLSTLFEEPWLYFPPYIVCY
jgi:hypothetical protein